MNEMNSFSLLMRDFSSEMKIPSCVPGSMYLFER